MFVALAMFLAMFAPLLTGDLAPDIGVETRYVDDIWVVHSVTRGGLGEQAGLRSGDVVEALDGLPPTNRRVLSPSLDINGVRSWRVSRNGAELVALVDARVAPFATRIEPLVMLVLAFVFACSGLFVRVFKPSDRLAVSYWRLSITTAIAIALAAPAARDNWWAKVLEVLAYAMAPAFFYEFCAAFSPTSRSASSGLARLLGISGVIVGIIYLVGGYLGAWWYDVARGALLALLAFGCLAGIAMLVRAYRVPASPRPRHQIQIVLFGAAAGVLPLTILSAIPEALGAPSIIRPQIAAFAVIALPVAVAYAIVRHQLLDINVVLSRTLVYATMSLLLAGCYALLLDLVSILTFERAQAISPALAGVFFAMVTACFIPLHNRVRCLTDRLIYRDRYDHAHFLRELAGQFASVAPIDEVLPGITQSIARAMNLQGAAILLQQPDGELAVRAATGAYADPTHAEELVARGTAYRNGHSSQPTDRGHWLPLVAHGGSAGLLYLGTKRTRVPLSAEDLSVAQTIASNAAISVANALLVDRLRAKVTELELLRDQLLHAEETERKRIAQDLHDGALHTLLAVVRQSEGLVEKVEADEANSQYVTAQIGAIQEQGRLAAYELRATCSDLYPSELEHLGLVAALESLTDIMRMRERLKVKFRRHSFPVDCRLEGAVEDAIYRAAREAFDNVTRHARARRVVVDLRLEHHAVVLSVQDDGCGFNANVPLSGVALLRSGHFGLTSMRERAERQGGSLEISSRRGSGFRIRVRIPCTPVENTLEARSA